MYSSSNTKARSIRRSTQELDGSRIFFIFHGRTDHIWNDTGQLESRIYRANGPRHRSHCFSRRSSQYLAKLKTISHQCPPPRSLRVSLFLHFTSDSSLSRCRSLLARANRQCINMRVAPPRRTPLRWADRWSLGTGMLLPGSLCGGALPGGTGENFVWRKAG